MWRSGGKMRIVILILLFCLWSVHSIKILCIFPTGSHSHHTIGYTLMKHLAARGHNVTYVSPFDAKEPVENLRLVVLTEMAKEWEELVNSKVTISQASRMNIFNILLVGHMSSFVVEKTLTEPSFQELLKSYQQFDVVLVEQFMNDGLLVVGHHFNAPLVLMSTNAQNSWSNHIVGNPHIPSYIPSTLIEPPVHETFVKRLLNFLMYIYEKLFFHLYIYPKQNEIIHKYFPNSPHIYDLIYNTSLIIYNSDFAFSQPLPQMPNMIGIGGFHVEPPNELPEDLQQTLDNAKNGVIYFSMGSILKSKDIPVTLRDDILRVFGTLKETVLWKFEEDLPGKPSNVIIRKWFPQSDILAHPNVKLFITHGGLLSTIESMSRGVPVIGIPVFGDQQPNMMKVQSRGHGLMIPYAEFSAEKLSQALQEILNNPRYTEEAKFRSKVLRDQLVNPIDKAEYWIEYVVRHNGAKHLRSAALDLTWYQRASLDVLSFLVVTSTVSIYLFFKITRRLIGRRKLRKQKTS